MEQRDYLLELYSIYSKLLTENEKNYFEYYYYEDYSLNEIADLMKVSKSYVGKMIGKIEKKIFNYESLLNINNKNDNIRKIISKLHDKSIINEIEELL